MSEKSYVLDVRPRGKITVDIGIDTPSEIAEGENMSQKAVRVMAAIDGQLQGLGFMSTDPEKAQMYRYYIRILENKEIKCPGCGMYHTLIKVEIPFDIEEPMDLARGLNISHYLKDNNGIVGDEEDCFNAQGFFESEGITLIESLENLLSIESLAENADLPDEMRVLLKGLAAIKKSMKINHGGLFDKLGKHLTFTQEKPSPETDGQE